MSLGHIDRVTRQFIAGWAADPRRPNDPVDIVIIVNGKRMAQVTCDIFRADLRARGIYGEGKHGFRYEFLSPLPDDVEIRVTTRLVDSGAALGKGDVVLPRKSGGGAVVVPAQNAFVIPAPSSPDELFRMFNFYNESQGISSFLHRFDFSQARRAQLDYAAFGEISSSLVRDESWTEQEARDYFESLLLSQQFQFHIIAHLLHAYPEKRRIIFLHIPKCAGTDLASHLAIRYPFVTHHWREENWTNKADLFFGLSNLVRELQFSQSIFVSGHVALGYYADRGLIRPADRIFTVIRDPIEIAVSAINYLLSRFEKNITTRKIDPDVKSWISLLGIDALPTQMTPQFTNDIIKRALRNPKILRPNSICYWLGQGNMESAVRQLAQNHVEITNTGHYADWLERKWGISSETRANVSTKYLRILEMDQSDVDYIYSITEEDRKFYGLVCERLAASESASIFGEDLL